jgi:hypothetical protein
MRSAARAPDAAATAVRAEDAVRRRQTMSSMILADQSKMGKAPTAGKPVLGA